MGDFRCVWGDVFGVCACVRVDKPQHCIPATAPIGSGGSLKAPPPSRDGGSKPEAVGGVRGGTAKFGITEKTLRLP